MWFVAKGVPAVMVVMFHNLNPGHFFSSCTHTGVLMACDWLLLSKPCPVIGWGVAWQMSHTTHDMMAAWHTPLPVPPPPSWPGARGDPPWQTWILSHYRNWLCPALPGWESVRNTHRGNLGKIFHHHTILQLMLTLIKIPEHLCESLPVSIKKQQIDKWLPNSSVKHICWNIQS